MATDPRRVDWILVPGTLCTGAVFDPLLDALGVPRDRRRVVPLTQPDVGDYRAALTDAAEGAVFCGFSLGAIVLAHLADLLPASRILLFGLNPHADDPAKAAGRHALCRDVAATGGAAAMAARLPDLRGPRAGPARAAILEMAEATATDIEAQTALALGRPGALPALSRATAPILVLTGGADRQAPPALGRAAADAAPRGRFVELPGLGHYALLEDPAACAAAVAAWKDPA